MDILAKKGVDSARAAKAVEKTLDLAASVILAEPRRQMARRRIQTGQRAGEELCRRLDTFVGEVAKLPPSSKFLLSQSIQRSLARDFFDADIFFSVLDTIAATLPALTPKVRADAAYAGLFEGDGVNRGLSSQSSPQLLWEELDAETRRRCEITIESKLPTGNSLFRILADAFRTPASSFARGAPPSLLRDYARSVDRIWHTLGIMKGRRRYDCYDPKSQLSAFAKFTNEALEVVGSESRVSDRQIRQALGERKRRLQR